VASNFKDQVIALRMRDAIRQLVKTEVEKLRPRPRVGVITSVSQEALTCTVKDAGDDDEADSITVNLLPGIQPIAVGQVVRFEGNRGNLWVTSVLSDRPRINANEVNTASISLGGIGVAGFVAAAPLASDSPASYPLGSSIRLVAADSSWPSTDGLVITHQYDSLVRQFFYDKTTNAAWTRVYTSSAWLTWSSM
jgi:hypothetical protein